MSEYGTVVILKNNRDYEVIQNVHYQQLAADILHFNKNNVNSSINMARDLIKNQDDFLSMVESYIKAKSIVTSWMKELGQF